MKHVISKTSRCLILRARSHHDNSRLPTLVPFHEVITNSDEGNSKRRLGLVIPIPMDPQGNLSDVPSTYLLMSNSKAIRVVKKLALVKHQKLNQRRHVNLSGLEANDFDGKLADGMLGVYRMEF